MSCLFFGCTSEVGHLFENGVGHIHENKVGIFLENLGLMVGHFPEKSHWRKVHLENGTINRQLIKQNIVFCNVLIKYYTRLLHILLKVVIIFGYGEY